MAKRRTDRLNSLLKEVISEVIRRDVDHVPLPGLITVTGVRITDDLHFAKVFVSVIGTPQQQRQAIDTLQAIAGFIAVTSSKKVVMRYFPQLTFQLDDSINRAMRIEQLLTEIHDEQQRRPAIPEEQT